MGRGGRQRGAGGGGGRGKGGTHLTFGVPSTEVMPLSRVHSILFENMFEDDPPFTSPCFNVFKT